MYSARVKNNENSWAERRFKQSSDRLANTPRRTWGRTLAGRLSAWQGCCKKIPETGQLVHSWKLFSQLQKLRSAKQIQWQILSIVKARIFGWWVAPTLDIPWQQGKARFLGTFVKGIIPLCISFMAYGLLKGILYINIFPSGSRYLHVNLEGCEQ